MLALGMLLGLHHGLGEFDLHHADSAGSRQVSFRQLFGHAGVSGRDSSIGVRLLLGLLDVFFRLRHGW